MSNTKSTALSILGGLLVCALCSGIAGCGSGSGATPGPTPTPTPTPNPTPTVTSISPGSAPAGALAFTLTVKGSNFVAASTVEWNGSNRTTTFVSSTQLQAHIMAADLASPGKIAVTVVNPSPGGGSSSPATFTVVANTIAFQSARALDGSDAANTNFVVNVWVVNPDGSSAKPLTKLTASAAHSLGPVAWAPDGSKMAFSSARALDGSNNANFHDTLNICVVNPDGSGLAPLTRLTASGASSGGPAWSRAGSKIVFASAGALDGSDAANTNGASNIWMMNADGSNPTPLTRLTALRADSSNPIWSTDGSKIVFVSTRALDGSDASTLHFNQNIWVMNSDGSSPLPLTKITAIFTDSNGPAWSPNGSKIVFASARALDGSDAANTNGTSNIWIMNADGSGPTPLTRLTTLGPRGHGSAMWSPDGSKIVFVSSRALDGSDAINTNGTSNIWMMNADGSGPAPLTKLTANGADSSVPVWWPGGTKILFASQRALDGSNAANTNSTRNIWVMNADGSGATPLTKLTAAGADSDHPEQP